MCLGEGWCQERESNPRPKAYESSALPLSYPGDCGDGNKPFTPGKIQPKLLRAIARAQFRIAGGPMWHGHPARVWRSANSVGPICDRRQAERTVSAFHPPRPAAFLRHDLHRVRRRYPDRQPLARAQRRRCTRNARLWAPTPRAQHSNDKGSIVLTVERSPASASPTSNITSNIRTRWRFPLDYL